MIKYCSYEFRTNKEYRESLTKKERGLMLILMAFGANLDPVGYDDGDYNEAMVMLLGELKETNNET